MCPGNGAVADIAAMDPPTMGPPTMGPQYKEEIETRK